MKREREYIICSEIDLIKPYWRVGNEHDDIY